MGRCRARLPFALLAWLPHRQEPLPGAFGFMKETLLARTAACAWIWQAVSPQSLACSLRAARGDGRRCWGTDVLGHACQTALATSVTLSSTRGCSNRPPLLHFSAGEAWRCQGYAPRCCYRARLHSSCHSESRPRRWTQLLGSRCAWARLPNRFPAWAWAILSRHLGKSPGE